MGNTYTFKIYKDGVLNKEFANKLTEGDAFLYLLKAQDNSVSYALRHGGWKVEEINEKTGGVSFWGTDD